MIRIKSLHKNFHVNNKKILAVDQLDLTVPEGDVFGVIGYSGAGKSTFVRLLNRLEEPTSGTVTIDDEEITSMPLNHLRTKRQNIGMIFQHFNLLWSRTVKQNIQFPLEIAGIPKSKREERAKELMHLVGLTDKENTFPSQLSGGQKQRVGIARALANNPKVLLCDEATSALDPETTNAILDLLVDINKKLGLTIILITHEMHVIRKICHQVAVMANGRIIEKGDVLDVFLHPKEKVTQRFVEQVMGPASNIDDVLENIVDHANSKIAQLHFVGEKTNQALISTISKEFPVDVNILQGNIAQTQRGAYGTLLVKLEGESDDILHVIDFIRNVTSVEIEVMDHVR